MNSALRHGFAATLAAGFLATSLSAQSNTFPATGNVGIGTTTPGSGALNVYQPAARSNAAMIEVNNADTAVGFDYGIWLKNRNATPGNFTSIVNWDSAMNGNAWIEFINVDHTTPKGQLAFATRNGGSWSRRMVINENGNVGIGVATPQASLDIWKAYNAGTDSLRFSYNDGNAYWMGIQPYVVGACDVGYLFRTNNGSTTANALAITGTGNIGIGTTAPQAKLHVAGAGAASVLMDQSPDGGKKYSISSRWGGYFTIWNESDPSLSGNPRIAVNTSGSVGINTLFPYGMLGVNVSSPYGQIGSSNTIALRNTDPTPWNATSIINYDASGAWYPNAAIDFLNANHGGQTGAGVIRMYTKRADQTVLTEALRIDSSGNVGIGTTNPTNKLEVAGTIRAKEVIVETTGWSDYVFAPDYRLAPLSEVEAHIAAKGTLPGIPSASEVATQGVSVGDMQAKLLAKIEELTLRQIAQEKEIQRLRAEVATLKKDQP